MKMESIIEVQNLPKSYGNNSVLNGISFDNTGTHQSQGKSTIGPSQSLLDLKAALTYIKSNDKLNNLDIMLYGHSWGAYAVTAILDYDFNIAAVASIAGFNSPMELLKEQADNVLGVISPISYPVFLINQKMIFGNTIGVTATQGINNTDIPIMIIHGQKDEAIAYNGASIIANKDEITNPNVIYKTCNAENHNGHNNLFQSKVATEYINNKNLEYKETYDKYNGEIPDDIKAKYYEDIDRLKSSELDVDFMDEINLFFEMQLE